MLPSLGQLKQLFQTTGDDIGSKIFRDFREAGPSMLLFGRNSRKNAPNTNVPNNSLFTLCFSHLNNNVIQRWMRGNVRLKVQNSSKLPHMRARFHCNVNEQC